MQKILTKTLKITVGVVLMGAALAGRSDAVGRALYIRKDGTRLYKDPAPNGGAVYSYRRKDGTLVRHYVAAHRPARKYRYAKKRRSTTRYRRSTTHR